jgi:2-amino-4-hydroxy-6-hydroxymethyldihydropteridine diphosphokinase
LIQAALSIGSNLGDRLANLQFALDQLARQQCELVAVSSVYETDPVGGVPQDSYLNAAVIINTQLLAEELLRTVLDIEDQAHRVREVRWGPRTLDIDVIDVIGFSNSTDELTVPHPRAHERAFVLAPLLQIAPEWKLGGTQSISDLLVNLSDQKVVECIDLKLKGIQE